MPMSFLFTSLHFVHHFYSINQIYFLYLKIVFPLSLGLWDPFASASLIFYTMSLSSLFNPFPYRLTDNLSLFSLPSAYIYCHSFFFIPLSLGLCCGCHYYLFLYLYRCRICLWVLSFYILYFLFALLLRRSHHSLQPKDDARVPQPKLWP